MDLVNALKSIFTRNTSAASTSGARVPILNSSGEPIGSDTMPNLASVLGGKIRLLSQTLSIEGNSQQTISLPTQVEFGIVSSNGLGNIVVFTKCYGELKKITETISNGTLTITTSSTPASLTIENGYNGNAEYTVFMVY